jgi:N-acetyl-gamma-glutamyl-phosphate reductase common form
VTPIPCFVLGGTGYVAGELLRLLVSHPGLEVCGVMSESQAGTRIREVFPQLQNRLGDQQFQTRESLLNCFDAGPAALFSAAPHGASAALVEQFIRRAGETGTELTIVDVSADFRFARPEDYAAVYGHPHGAPGLLGQFASAVPEHLPESNRPHVGHPGCFATALLMATVPLMQKQLSTGDLHAVGITGSTGSGRSLSATTHHPERHANLFAYKPLAHRHAPEVVGICETLTGIRPALRFVPHSGPFARGIHLTLQAKLADSAHADDLRAAFAGFYAGQPFVTVCDGPPRIKDVVGSNYCHIGVDTDGESLVVLVVIDNLVKGAAGGAIQWMNRQLGLPETTGLEAPALAWA